MDDENYEFNISINSPMIHPLCGRYSKYFLLITQILYHLLLARSLPNKLEKIILIYVHPIIQKPDVSIHLTVAVKVNKAYIFLFPWN